jgi:hypothetical protein
VYNQQHGLANEFSEFKVASASLSGNQHDFGQKTVTEVLSNEGIHKYVTKVDEFLGWFSSQR